MKSIKLLIIALLAVPLLFTSCATLLSGSSKQVTFTSEAGAAVYQNGRNIGQTNTPLDIERADMVKYYEIKKEGCKTAGFELPLTTTSAFWVDVPLAFTGIGLAALCLDLAKGNQHETEKAVSIDLDCSK